MKKIKNPNHPKKGSTIKVEPIRRLKDIETIKKLLADKPRDLALFTVGINTNLRASDLLNLKVYQVRNLKPNDEIEIKEKMIINIMRDSEVRENTITRVIEQLKELKKGGLRKDE